MKTLATRVVLTLVVLGLAWTTAGQARAQAPARWERERFASYDSDNAQSNQRAAEATRAEINAGGRGADWKEATVDGPDRRGVYVVYAQHRVAAPAQAGPATFKVTIHWDNTFDVDLGVLEPGDELCYYGKKTTRNGGRLSQDIQRGPGDEVYEIAGGPRGTYRIRINLYSTHGQPVAATPVRVTLQVAGQQPQTFTVTLDRVGAITMVRDVTY